MATELHPRLLFNSGEVTELRRRIAAGPRSREHLALALGVCDRLLDPASPEYFDFRERQSAIWKGREGNFIIPHHVLTLALVGTLMERRDYLQAAADALLTLVREKIAERGLGDYKTWRGGAQGHDAGKYYFTLGVAYDLTWPLRDEASRREVVEHARETIEVAATHYDRYRYLVENNQGGRYLAGVLVLAQAVRGELEPLPRFAINMLTRQGYWLSKALRLNYDPQGVPREGHSYGLGSMIFYTLVAHIIARPGGPDHRNDARIAGYGDFCVHEMVYPEGWINPINDSFEMHMGQSVYYAGVMHNKPACLWLWDQYCRDATHPMSTLRAMTEDMPNLDLVPWLLLWPDDAAPTPQPPLACGYPLSKYFRGRGLVVVRSGFGVDDFHLSMVAGENPQHFHSQADQNQVTLNALGERWIIDPGYSPVDPATGQQVSGRPSEAHNNVHIDGVGQMSKDSPDGWPRGEIAVFREESDGTYVLGRAVEAYPPRVRVIRADRHLLVRPPQVLWLDDYQTADGGEHDYTLTLHAPPGKTFEEAGEGRFTIRSDRGSDAQLDIHVVATAPIAVRHGTFVDHRTLHLTMRTIRGRFALLLHARLATDVGAKLNASWTERAVTLEAQTGATCLRRCFDTN